MPSEVLALLIVAITVTALVVIVLHQLDRQ
jgi:hypothetical protein